MQPEMILKSDVLDILFENRNKAYGAYVLRREYESRVGKSILITFFFAALLLLFLFEFNTEKKKITHPNILNENFISNLRHSMSPKETQPKQPKRRRFFLPVASAAVQTKPIIVNNTDVHRPILPTSDLVNKNISLNTNISIHIAGQQNIQTDGATDGKVTASGTGRDENAIDIRQPINNPDVMPEFPGGMKALKHYLEINIHQPENEDLDDGQAVNVKVRFIVSYDGSLLGFDILQSGGDAYDDEVMQVLKGMPHWIPGKSNGQNVSVYYVVPVSFLVK